MYSILSQLYTCLDLPGVVSGRSDMSDQEDALAARGALDGCVRNAVDRDDDRCHRPWCKSDFPSDDAAFERCSK